MMLGGAYFDFHKKVKCWCIPDVLVSVCLLCKKVCFYVWSKKLC